MIDTELINRSASISPQIKAIDESWNRYIEEIQDSMFHIPFRDNYTMILENNNTLIEAYSGKLIIDKLYFQHKIYLLTKPVIYDSFKIYGVYDSTGRFQYFISKPEIGFHYIGMTSHGRQICTGELTYKTPESYALLKETAQQLADVFRIINMESLGETVLPDEYQQLKNAFALRRESARAIFRKLDEERLIKPIL